MAEGLVYGGSGLSSIDGKGRVTIPSELRQTVEASSGGNFVCLARHTSLPCIIGFGRAERQRQKDDLDFRWRLALERGEDFDREAEGARQAASFAEVGFEPSGRFVLPPMLRHFGGLGAQAFFYGNIWHFCIWDPERLRAQGDRFAMQREILDYHAGTAGGRGK